VVEKEWKGKESKRKKERKGENTGWEGGKHIRTIDILNRASGRSTSGDVFEYVVATGGA
jgi:hypothetical protein